MMTTPNMFTNRESSTSTMPNLPFRLIRILFLLSFMLLALSLTIGEPTRAADVIREVCPPVGIQTGGPGFEPGGIILTAFDNSAIWVYNIDSGRRYPLPETTPCAGNCRLSSDARWITYFNALTRAFNKMRLDGTQRTFVNAYASDIDWWADGTFLVWTPGHNAYLQAEGSDEREYLNVEGVISVQPGGRWGVLVEHNGDGFIRDVINLELRDMDGISDGRLALGVDLAYFNAHAWSPDGAWLAYVAPTLRGARVTGSEIYGVRPGAGASQQWTDLTSVYGRARVNGLSVGELSWSPDSTRIAFWVTPLIGPDPAANTGSAMIHVLDVATGAVTQYCGFTTTEHTPNPPRLLWSPDGSALAFSGNVPEDDKGYMLLALDLESGIFTMLSEGVFPTFGSADLVAWGLPPG